MGAQRGGPHGVRLLVCGGRDFDKTTDAYVVLDDLHTHLKISLVIHGAARGADRIAWEWALSRNIPVATFPADWDRWGRRAGPLRNQQMLDEGKPEMVLAFPGGRGTEDMVARAKRACLPVVRP